MREHEQDAGQTSRPLDRLTGAILDGRYRMDEKLAAGGFGSIYRATDLVMGRAVALKVLHRELTYDDNVVARFRREAAALARLRDPHTITMYDVGEAEDGTLYIVLELLRGESLFERFHAQGRMPWRRVVAIARGVCSAMREAHACGIVHRDLKPANIYLEQHALQSDYVKVLDFGIAKIVEGSELEQRDLTLHGQMVGTFDYMPPEQLIGGACNGRSDVFTLGVVIYEMIAGARPFGEARGPASMLMTVLGTAPVPLAQRANVPAALDALVMRCLARDPSERIDIGPLDDELARILDAEEARFDDDGPTWIDPPFRANATLMGTIAPPRTLPLPPPQHAVGSKTEIPPLVTPAGPLPVPPARLATGTTPIANKAPQSLAWLEYLTLVVLAVVLVYLLWR